MAPRYARRISRVECFQRLRRDDSIAGKITAAATRKTKLTRSIAALLAPRLCTYKARLQRPFAEGFFLVGGAGESVCFTRSKEDLIEQFSCSVTGGFIRGQQYRNLYLLVKAEQRCLSASRIKDRNRPFTPNDQLAGLKLQSLHIHASLRRQLSRSSAGYQCAVLIKSQLLPRVEVTQNKRVPHQLTGKLLLELRITQRMEEHRRKQKAEIDPHSVSILACENLDRGTPTLRFGALITALAPICIPIVPQA